MQFSDLVRITGGTVLHQVDNAPVTKFSIDTRKISGRPNEVFIAIQGKQHDGHSFLIAAFEAGVRTFIVERSDIPQFQANVLLVNSSVKALQHIAAAHRRQFHYPVIGITGSNGKTTVKEWLAELLSRELKVVKSPKSFNSQVGVPLSVLEMGAHEVGVFEAGISQTGEMENLAAIIQPTIGIFTNIGEAHGDGFDSVQQKIEEKAKLFASAQKIICRKDHQLVYQHLTAQFPNRIISWSLSDDAATYRFEVVGESIKLKGSELSVDLPFDNANQVENALHAIVAALESGISNEEIAQGVRAFRSVPMRLELKKAINGCYVIDDSYNNDLVGLEVALDFMNQQNPHQSKTVILSDILQSSLPNEELYFRVQSLLKAKGIQRVFVIGKHIEKHFKMDAFSSTEAFINQLPTFDNETILVKGARSFAFERIVSRLQDQSHGTVLEINFEALRNNLNTHRQLLKPKTKLMVMVKAFAYGAGLSEIAGFLQHERVDYLGVAYVDEAVQLRKKGITLPIMIMNPEETDFELFERYDLEAEVYHIDVLRRLIQSGANVGIHLKMETGMNRLGFSENELPDLLAILTNHPDITIKGIFTHFSSSDSPSEDAYTHAQAAIFDPMVQQISAVLGYTPMRHAVNSPGMIRFPEYHFEMVRLGIGLYGFDPTGKLTLETVGTLKTHVSQVKKLAAGESIGYSRKGRAKGPTEIAIIPIGYADGYRRAFGNGAGKVWINGQLAPTIGNICMDMSMVDVTGMNVTIGDEVIVFGNRPTIKELADWAGTIPYEILTSISQRVKRVYVSE